MSKVGPKSLQIKGKKKINIQAKSLVVIEPTIKDFLIPFLSDITRVVEMLGVFQYALIRAY
jgi:hypothetical protein